MIKKRPRFLIFCLLLMFLSDLGRAQSENTKTKVLVLGTPHLAQIKGFEPEMLDGIIDHLSKEGFNAVCIENMPAELLYDIRSRNDDAFSEVLSHFGGDRLNVADSVQKELGLSFQEAEKSFYQLAGKKQLSNQEHLLMIEYALALADPLSALLHYDYLGDTLAYTKSKLPKKRLDELIKNSENDNEIFSLALTLAKSQKLNKLEYIDNFQDEALLFKFFPDFIQDYQDNQELFKDIASLPVFVEGDEVLERSIRDEDLSEYYRYLNSDRFMEQDFEAQWEIWLRANFPSGTAKARYYLWEMRNLQIVANIMKVCSFYPGQKVLVLIGASHKSFIEKYLRQISDIEILSFEN